MTPEYTKPLPRPVNEELTRPFWDAVKNHRLVMPHCKHCANLFFYPREQCPNCYSSDTEWVIVSGKGRLYAFTVVYQPSNPVFQPDTPDIYAIVQLDEGPRIPTNLVDCELADAQIDMPVEVAFEDVSDDATLVKFRPA